MKVYVNNIPVDLLPGMTVRHALIQAGLLEELEKSKRVLDEWGNEISLDGTLSDGENIYLS
jgi:hypothetical protein